MGLAGNRKKIAIGVVHTGDRLQNEQQARTRAVTQAYNTMPFARAGPVIVGVVFPAGTPVQVAHRLGRPWKGYVVVRSYGANIANGIGEAAVQVGDPSVFITLITTLACTRDIVFF